MTAPAMSAGRALRDIPIEQYGADQFDTPQPTLNSSTANRLLTRSPLHAWWSHPRLGGMFEEANNDMNIGSAAHALLLEGRDIIVSCPFDDWRTKAAKEMRDDVLSEGRIPLLTADAFRVQQMVINARRLLDSSPDLAGLGPLDSELTYVWRDERVSVDGVERETWMRCRPDAVTTDRAIVLSYKTTRSSAEPDAYMRTLLNAGYEMQAAFELAGIEAVDGVRPAHYVWLVQEADEPYACSLIGLSPEMRTLGLARMDAAVARWAECMAAGQWPGYPERIAYPLLPPWKLAEIEELIG